MSSRQRVFKFNDNETTRFLELYSIEKVLYDPTTDKYRDRDLRAAAANRISKELNIPGFGPKEVIAKFKNLRSSYCQELKKISDSERSGNRADDIYKPKVFWFEQMNSYIRPFIQQRPTQSNLVLCIENSQKQSKEKQSESEIEHSTNVHSKDTSTETNQQSEPEIKYHASLDIRRKRKKRKVQSHPSTSKNKKTIHDHEIMFMTDAIEKLHEISNKASQVNVNKEDSFDHFGKYVASMLRSIGQPIAMRLQQNITNMIANAICPPQEVIFNRDTSEYLTSDNSK